MTSFNIDERRIEHLKYNKEIFDFLNTIFKNIDLKNLELLKNNINNFKIYRTNANSSFDCENMIIKTNNTSINYELLEMAASYYDSINKKQFVGFMQKDSNNYPIGIGLNKGYTQVLVDRYFNGKNKNFRFEKMIAKQLEKIIGKDEMESFYFNADLYSLIEKLKSYDDEGQIMKFLFNIDYVGNNIYKDIIKEQKQMGVLDSLTNIYNFLTSCYIKKMENDNTFKSDIVISYIKSFERYASYGEYLNQINHSTIERNER